jgi:uncharacterized membrane protein YhaH (DUF805 family)
MNLLSFYGKASRQEWWLVLVGTVAIMWTTISFVGQTGWVYWILWAVTDYFFYAVSTRRLRDHGKTGTYIGLFLLPVIIAEILSSFSLSGILSESVLGIVAVLCGLYMIIVFGFLKGK